MSRIRYQLICAVALCAPVTATFAIEYQEAENIAPESAEVATVGVQAVDEARVWLPRRGLLHDALAKRSPFWRDSALDFGVRAYDLQRENAVESIAEAFAAGTELTFRSGQWRERLSTVLSWHTSFKIDAPEGSGDTGLLGPGQSNLSVISRAWLQLGLTETLAMRLYRQDFNLPYINRNDSRMIPITHEAYMLRYPGEKLQWLFGQVTKIKRRDSEEFIPMGEAAGAEGNDAGTTVGVARWQFNDQSTLAGVAQHTRDLFTTSYVEGVIPRTFSDDWGMQLTAQLTNQWSTGEELLGDFSTYSWGLRGKVSFRGTILMAAYTSIGDARIRNPFGGTPSYNSTMLSDFDRAQEQAFRIGLSHNFARRGFPGISIAGNYTQGRHAETNDGGPLPDADVISVTVDFRPERSFLKGIWLRVRFADLDRGSPENDRREVRIILNYSLEALQ